MNPQRQLRQVRLETNIANEFKLNADAFVVDISELFDEVVTQFLTEHKHKKITYLSQPKEIPVTNVRLLPSVLEKLKNAPIKTSIVSPIFYIPLLCGTPKRINSQYKIITLRKTILKPYQ